MSVPGWASKVRFGLPLLVKDLTELAARRRTYIVRAVYAVALFIGFGVIFYAEVYRLGGASFLVLGIGRRLFASIFALQVAGICLFLPAMASGCITEEREKGTLDLLLITDLTPGEIVLQKLVGRLMPMLTLLFVSVPLMTVCYAYGGLSSGEVLVGALVLVTTCVEVGAFSVMVSAHRRTSSEALVATYGYYLLLLVAAWFAAGIGSLLMIPLFATRSLIGTCIAMIPAVLATGLTPPVAMGTVWGSYLFSMAVIVAAWGWSAVFVLKARRYLVERAVLRPKRRKHSFFGGMVRYARREAARRRKRGLDDRSHLPADEPILWKETTNTYLDWPHGFRGSLGFVMFPLAYVALAAALSGRTDGQCGWMTAFVYAMWATGTLSVTVRSSRAFSLERANRTLDVLLATPLAGSEIVREKMQVSRRLALLFTVPLVTLFVIEAWREMYEYSLAEAFDAMLYLAAATLAVFVSLRAFAWVSLLVGMRLNDARRATLVALALIFAWNAAPPFVAGLAGEFLRGAPSELLAWFAMLSPVAILTLVERGSYDTLTGVSGAAAVAGGLALNWLALHLVRRACLRNADRYLGRPVPTDASPRTRAPAVTVGRGTEGGAA